MSPPPKIPETEKPLSTKAFLVDASSRVSSLDAKARTSDQRSFNEVSHTSVKNEINNFVETSSPVVALPNQGKPTKKSKKKHLIGKVHNDHGTNINASKAQEKAHRKALRMFQKLSKTQTEGDGSSSSMMSLKKSMKNLNRSMLSMPDKSTERTQLEKLIKKQTKQRQRQLKSQKQQQQRQLQSMTKSPGSNGYPALNQSIPLFPMSLSSTSVIQSAATPVAPSLIGVPNNYTFGSTSLVPSTLIEKNEKFSPEISQSGKGTILANDSFLDEIKLASEPDRNKLNIFKKLSKSKPTTTPKAPSPTSHLNIATNLFGNASNGSPLINLPSGTTITPAPALNVIDSVTVNMSPNKINQVTSSISMTTTYDNDQSINQVAVATSSATQIVTDVHRPKKRGRKPGGKNCVRSTELTQKSET